MTRRTVPALVALAAVVLTATGADAITRTTRLCIDTSRQVRRSCVVQCTEDYRLNYATCFGPGSFCATACIQEQAACQQGPAAGQVACQRDTTLEQLFPASGLTGGACNSRLRAALAACPDDPNPDACAGTARASAIQCQTDCRLAFLPQLSVCNNQFQDCVEACASQR